MDYSDDTDEDEDVDDDGQEIISARGRAEVGPRIFSGIFFFPSLTASISISRYWIAVLD